MDKETPLFAESGAIIQHAADVATSCGGCGVTAMFCAKSLAGACCEVCNHTERIVTLVRRVRDAEAAANHLATILDDYAPIARKQRGCGENCGCTDCEMVEDLRAAMRFLPDKSIENGEENV